MKRSLNIHAKMLLSLSMLFIVGLPNTAFAAVTGPVNLATSPLATSTTTVVKPNLMFVLDNSGSMDWDHMPDDDGDGGSAVTFQFGYYGLRSSQCNQVYFDPSITYLPPVDASGTSYPDASFTAAYGGLQGGYASSPTTVNLNTGFKASKDIGEDTIAQSAYYYSYSGEQDTQLERNYNSTTNAFFKECSDSTGGSSSSVAPLNGVKALTGGAPATVGSGVFSKRRLSTDMTTTIVVSGTNSTSVTSIKVDGKELLPAATVADSSSSNVAENIKTKINLCTTGITGLCTVSGYSAVRSGSTVTITAPTSAANHVPVITQSGSMTLTTDIFPDITAANLTNFANWYSYYRTRMLMMKTASGRAFSSLNNNYRVGLMKISSSSTPVLEVGTFENAHRTSWYNALYTTTTSGSTPLRTALSNAGRYYAGQLGGADPMQYSCQQNFSILSTDGYWNSGDGFKMDGSTAVGNQDGTAARPMYDGAQAGDTVTTTYTRNKYSSVSSDCPSKQKKLMTQPEIGTCSITTANGVTGSESCNWASNGSATYGSCAKSSSIILPSLNPSARVQVGSPVSTPGALGGTSDNLADIAMYYYQTDLRPGTCTLCTDNVFKSSTDDNDQQHMTTFTLGLGASGWMNYSSSYLSDSTGDYVAVKLGSTASTTVCTWQSTGTVCNWPVPGMTGSDGLIANIDDLWHAAVNGRGAYFSATNPASLSSGLANALAAINARKGSAAAAAASTLNPVAGDNSAYVASYTTVAWKGNLEARGINTDTGVVNENATWCVENVVAGTCNLATSSIVSEPVGDTTVAYCVTPNSTICTGGELIGSNCKVPVATACTGTMNAKVTDTTDTRNIWTKGPGAATLNNFKIAGGDLSAADFDTTKLSGLSQWSALDATQKTAAVANVVNYLRGQTGFDDRTANDDGTTNNRLFRYREATLGDAVESQPAYIGKPTFSYTDTGYSAFKSAQASRPGTVYMGANDGMMHAFDAATGVERWAYVPSMVIPNLWALADKNYATNHAYYVNGSPIISDIYDGGTWKTILVAGLNGGGRGYYALDITDPVAPKLLWEFTPTNDANLGYTFGNPVVTKKTNTDGTQAWVVLVTSGYNNIPDTSPRVKYPLISTGDGKGYLYVLDAGSGTIIGSPISTGVGNPAVPSGLAQIATWVDDPEKNNTAVFTYGGDLLGNVWRFDINAGTVVKFAELKVGSAGQPITTRPELGSVLTSDGKVRKVVFIGTGKYLETADLTDMQQQTLYAIKDDDTPKTSPATAALVDPRTSSTMVQQTLTASGSSRVASNYPVNFITDRGWFVDLGADGERQNVASQLVLGTLLVPTTVPSNTVCAPGGTGWLSYFNYRTGGAVNTSTNTVSTRITAPIVGVNVMYIDDSNGKKKPVVSGVTADNPTPTVIPNVEFPPASSGFQKKRVIWRELVE